MGSPSYSDELWRGVAEEDCGGDAPPRNPVSEQKPVENLRDSFGIEAQALMEGYQASVHGS
jgi:hypothetical protein